MRYRDHGRVIMPVAGARTIVGRRRVLALMGSAAGLAILAACGDTAATETPRPAATTAPIAPITPIATVAPAATAAATTAMTAPVNTTAAVGSRTTGMATMPTLMVEAFEYGFRTMGTILAGVTMVQLKNTGKEDHHVQIIRLNDGVTTDRFMAALPMGAGGIARLSQNVGGAGAVAENGTSAAIIELKEGQHFLICHIPSRDGVPHLAKGMVLPLRVTPAMGASAAMPTTLGTVTMSDFAFTLPMSTLSAGRSLLRVTNEGAQAHECNIVRLMPGKKPEDITQFLMQPMGPPPFIPMGGMQALEKGMSGIAVLDLMPGDYAAVCNIPDPMSSKAHTLLGMIAGLTVK